MKYLSLLAAIIVLPLFSSESLAGCRNDKDVCGSPDICLSNNRAGNANDLSSCTIEPTICGVLKETVKQFGPVEIDAAYRGYRAATAGGAPNSMHNVMPNKQCVAVDFSVKGKEGNQKQKDMLHFFASQKCKGIRYNIYCTGTAHVDKSTRADGYEQCIGHIPPACKPGSEPSGGNSDGGGQGYVGPNTTKYTSRTRSTRPQCWNVKKYGTCCGPLRKANGYCSG